MWEEEGGRSRGDTWCWNEEVKDAVSKKKDAHNIMNWNGTEENKIRYMRMKNKAKKAV